MIKAEDIIAVICDHVGIERDNSGQFLSKQELLQVLAFIEKQNLHIKSMKKEIDQWRSASVMTQVHDSLNKE